MRISQERLQPYLRMCHEKFNLGDRLEAIANRVVERYAFQSWGYYDPLDPNCIEAFSIAQFEAFRYWNLNRESNDQQIKYYADLRMRSTLSHKSLAFNKPVSEHDNTPLEDREYTKQHDFREPVSHRSPDLEIEYENDIQRDVVKWLTNTHHSQKQIAIELDISEYAMKQTIRSIKKAETKVDRRERTANPKELMKPQNLKHGDPVTRMKNQICETLIDELLVDLYRNLTPIESISKQLGLKEPWVTHRLGVLAHRYLCM